MSLDDERQRKEKVDKQHRMIVIPLAGIATIFELVAGNYGLALVFAGLCAVWIWKGPKASGTDPGGVP